MWEPRRLTTLWASTASYRDSFTFFVSIIKYLPHFNKRDNSTLQYMYRHKGQTCMDNVRPFTSGRELGTSKIQIHVKQKLEVLIAAVGTENGDILMSILNYYKWKAGKDFASDDDEINRRRKCCQLEAPPVYIKGTFYSEK
jgi:hypothetical protein